MTMIDMCFERTQFSVLILFRFFPDIAWNCNMTPVYIWSATAARSRWHQNKTKYRLQDVSIPRGLAWILLLSIQQREILKP